VPPAVFDLLRYIALYLQISQDKTGRAEGVEAQEKWGREYAAATWPGAPVLVFCDNDLSAARDDVVRPAYEALRQAVRDGQVAHVWAVEQSRLERREVQWFELAAEFTAAGITELHTRREGIVRVGDVVAGIKAVLNAFEVRQMKGRLMDKLDEIAALGRPPGSRPFGLRHAVNDNGDKTYALVPEEAEAIRWAAVRVLAGWSLSSVAAALRERGLTGPHRVKVKDASGQVVKDEHGQPVIRASALTAGSVRSMVTNPTVAGHRIHRGVDVGKGNWEPILDEATWRACCARLATEREVTRLPNPDGSGPATYKVGRAHAGYSGRKYVLTGGLAVCEECKAPLVGSVKQIKGGAKRGGRDVAYLLCHPNRGGKGCVGIMLAETEQYVVDRLFAELDKPGFLDLIAVDDHAARREQIINDLAAIDGQRRELAKMWGDRKLTVDEWTVAKQAVDGNEQALRLELDAKPRPPARVGIEQARGAWPSMTLDEQRQFIRLFIDKVTIGRAAMQGKKGLDTGRIVITWRDRG